MDGVPRGTEVAGQVRSVVPAKVHVFKSTRFRDVDGDGGGLPGRGQRVILAAADEENIWLATDSGMILKLASKNRIRRPCFIHSQSTR